MSPPNRLHVKIIFSLELLVLADVTPFLVFLTWILPGLYVPAGNRNLTNKFKFTPITLPNQLNIWLEVTVF